MRIYLCLSILMLVIFAICAKPANCRPLSFDPDGGKRPTVFFWLESSLKRVFLTSRPGTSSEMTIAAPRGGQVSFQACLRNERASWMNTTCTVSGPQGVEAQVRRVDFVPVRFLTRYTGVSELEGVKEGFLPGLVPDILYPSQTADVGNYQTAPFWVTVRVPVDAKPGKHRLTVTFESKEEPTRVEMPVTLDVSSFVVRPRRDFRVTHWWNADLFYTYYKTGMFEDEKLWDIMRNYVQNMVDHGNDTLYVPIFFFRREIYQRPPQLLIVNEPSPGKYEFDFKNVSRFLKLARECGATHFEWSHLWIYWGARNPMVIYKWVDGKAVPLWPVDTDGHGEVYHNFLRQFLPAFHDFLVKEKALDQSFFHLSDEPGEGEHLENYRKARAFLREAAPWMKVMDALSNIEYGRQKLSDIPIPDVASASAYVKEGIPHWVYFCCGPVGPYLNRFMDTPLAKIRMSGWLFYKLEAQGFLHWGYNYWHVMESEAMIDPFTNPGWPPGDFFVVYPGLDGKPMDSIRWEVFAESLQDYAMLQTAGIKPDDPMLAGIKSYGDFPKTEKWIRDRLATILAKGQ